MSLTDIFEVIARGGKVTILATVLIGCIAIPVSFLVGTARAHLHSRLMRVVLASYVEIFRGTSAVVQLFIAFFVLPLYGIELTPFVAGVVVLGFNAGAYGSEIVRSALNSVQVGQSEAARALNLTRWDELRLVVLPQAIPVTIPPMESLAIEWFKATSLLSLISVAELTFEINTMTINGRLDLVPSYIALLVVYLLLSIPITQIGRTVDHYYGRGWRGLGAERGRSTPKVAAL